MKKIFFFLFGIFLLTSVTALSICIDHTTPEAPTNLILTTNTNSINLIWTEAQDLPDCSGISHYDLYRNGVFLISINTTSYEDIGLEYGTYEYIIHAWDLAGHNEGNGISNQITIEAPIVINPLSGGGSGGGGGGGADSSAFWQCLEWSECVNGTQERICTDLEEEEPNKTESKECPIPFIPKEKIELNFSSSLSSSSEQETTFLGPGLSAITGAAVVAGDFATSPEGASVLTVGILILASFIGIRVRKRKKHNPQPLNNQKTP